MSDNLAVRWMRRYKFFFLIGLLIIGLQVFLAYKSLGIPELSFSSAGSNLFSSSSIDNKNIKNQQNHNSVADDEDLNGGGGVVKRETASNSGGNGGNLNVKQLGFQPSCDIKSKEAISALHRAKTKPCRKEIANIACAIQSMEFYARRLPNYCLNSNYTANKPLGCYRDEKEYRLLSGYFTNFKRNNSPKKCIQMCLQSGFPYAGVQYGTECFCGSDLPPSAAKLPDSSCNMKCPDDAKEVCGGYFSMNVFETGIAKFTPQIAETVPKPDTERVRIAFLLTLNGRALRQVHRLIKALYSPNHVFYIHVDSRQDYLYRELLKLEGKFRNIRLARNRFSTIWGGASLLTMLMQCMNDLLASDWHWDFVINLSESDFPVKPVEKLANFLTANKGRNFVKSHGRETQRFIQKQGLDKTFVECDTHMWRIGDRVLPEGIQVDGGSDWIALSRPFVKYVNDNENNELLKGLLTIFRHTLLPAESFFHTVLRNSQFCQTYVDNNLHVTNWKRKLGCKCQYKHVVDWCGCSPNDFKPDDWARLQGTEQKMLFFARKFEPVINQAIILQLEEWLFGPYTSEYVNLNSYWQSLYHHSDKHSSVDDLYLTIANSLLRINGRKMHYGKYTLHEITNFFSNDEYKGFLLRYSAQRTPSNDSVAFETRIRPTQYPKVAKTSKFAKRLRSFEVSSDFDQKEQISRNFAKFLGPSTDVILSFTFTGSAHSDSHSYNLTVLWIDPMGRLQDFNEIHVEDTQSDAINFSKTSLKHPLTPGIWTVKLIGRTSIFAQTKFLISPLTFEHNKLIRPERSQELHSGSFQDISYPSDWQQHLPTSEDVKTLKELAQTNAKRTGSSLLNWVDDLISKFFLVRETCVASNVPLTDLSLPLCKDTDWSSLAPDPKSDVDALLHRRRR